VYLTLWEEDACACAPSGDLGPHPGRHSGEWLTSVTLALRAELVDLQAANGDVAAELRAAEGGRGAMHLERFVSAIADAVGAATRSRADPR